VRSPRRRYLRKGRRPARSNAVPESWIPPPPPRSRPSSPNSSASSGSASRRGPPGDRQGRAGQDLVRGRRRADRRPEGSKRNRAARLVTLCDRREARRPLAPARERLRVPLRRPTPLLQSKSLWPASVETHAAPVAVATSTRAVACRCWSRLRARSERWRVSSEGWPTGYRRSALGSTRRQTR